MSTSNSPKKSPRDLSHQEERTEIRQDDQASQPVTPRQSVRLGIMTTSSMWLRATAHSSGCRRRGRSVVLGKVESRGERLLTVPSAPVGRGATNSRNRSSTRRCGMRRSRRWVRSDASVCWPPATWPPTSTGGQSNQLSRDLRFLQQPGVVRVTTVNARRDGRAGKVERIELVTFADQQLYSGLVKPREVVGDTKIYRAYEKEATRIESQGGERLRVRLDFELKAQIQKAQVRPIPNAT